MNSRIKIIALIVISIIIYTNLKSQKINVDNNDLEYVFTDALKCIEFNDFSRAVYLLNNCIEADSTCSVCYYELSKIYFIIKDTINAINYANQALRYDKRNYWYNKNAAEIMSEFGRFKEAERIFEKMIKNETALYDDKFDLANLYFRIDKRNRALKMLKEIEIENGFSENNSILKYKYYLSKGKIDKAKNEINKILEYSDENVNLYGILAELSALQRKDSDAVKNYKIFLSADPNNVSALRSMGNFYLSRNDTTNAEIIFNKIFFNDKIDNNTKLLELNNLVKNVYKEFKLSYYLKMTLNKLENTNLDKIKIKEIAIDYFENVQDYNDAVEKCKELIKLKRNEPIYWEKLYYYYNILGDFNYIVNSADSITNIFAKRPFLFLMGGIAYFQLGDNLKAINLLKNGYESNNNSISINDRFILFLAESYYKIGKKDSTYYYFEIGLKNKTINLPQINNYAYYLAENNDSLEKALKLSALTIKNEAKNYIYLDTYAWIQYKLKNYRDAKKFIIKALKNGGDKEADIIKHSGDIYFCLGKIENSNKQWEKAIKLGYEKEKIIGNLKNLNCK